MLNIRELLTGLAESRKVFHSEADFQHALAWHIHQTMPKSQVRLEFPMPVEHRKMYVDIWLPAEKNAIELKYVTRKSELEDNKETFALLNQGAQDQRRYDFLQDIHRLELMRSTPELCEAGYAVLLTNDPSYWNPPRSRDTVDSRVSTPALRSLVDPTAQPLIAASLPSQPVPQNQKTLHHESVANVEPVLYTHQEVD